MPNRAKVYRPAGLPKPGRSPDRRANATDRGYGSHWRRVRAAYLREHPLCERCPSLGRGPVAACHVHHRDGLGPTGPRGFDHANLQSLCESCHNSHSATEAAAARRAKV